FLFHFYHTHTHLQHTLLFHLHHTLTNTLAHMHSSKHTHLYTDTHIYKYTHSFLQTHTHTHTCKYTHTHTLTTHSPYPSSSHTHTHTLTPSSSVVQLSFHLASPWWIRSRTSLRNTLKSVTILGSCSRNTISSVYFPSSRQYRQALS